MNLDLRFLLHLPNLEFFGTSSLEGDWPVPPKSILFKTVAFSFKIPKLRILKIRNARHGIIAFLAMASRRLEEVNISGFRVDGWEIRTMAQYCGTTLT